MRSCHADPLPSFLISPFLASVHIPCKTDAIEKGSLLFFYRAGSRVAPCPGLAAQWAPPVHGTSAPCCTCSAGQHGKQHPSFLGACSAGLMLTTSFFP